MELLLKVIEPLTPYSLSSFCFNACHVTSLFVEVSTTSDMDEIFPGSFNNSSLFGRTASDKGSDRGSIACTVVAVFLSRTVAGSKYSRG